MLRNFSKFTVLTFMSYSAAVEMNNNSPKRKVAGFNQGSADAMVMDNLNTGDILLFRREWHNYHIPTAAMILLYNYIHNTEFDHGALIVVDNAGAVFVVERTPFRGIKCRPFEDRILRSKASQIVLIPIEPHLPIPSGSVKQRFENLNLEGEVKFFFRNLLLSVTGSSNKIQCPSTTAIIQLYSIFGFRTQSNLDLQEATSNLNLASIYSRNINLYSLDGEKFSLLAQNVVIRTR